MDGRFNLRRVLNPLIAVSEWSLPAGVREFFCSLHQGHISKVEPHFLVEDTLRFADRRELRLRRKPAATTVGGWAEPHQHVALAE